MNCSFHACVFFFVYTSSSSPVNASQAIVDLLFRAMPTASQGQLTDLKCALTNNMTLGQLGATLNLHKHIITQSSSLMECFEDIHRRKHSDGEKGYGENTGEHEQSLPGGELNLDSAISNTQQTSYANGMKVLADVMEAVVGAIFIDSGGSMGTVQRVIQAVQVIPAGLLSHPRPVYTHES